VYLLDLALCLFQFLLSLVLRYLVVCAHLVIYNYQRISELVSEEEVVQKWGDELRPEIRVRADDDEEAEGQVCHQV